MKIFELTKEELKKNDLRNKVFLLESQVYGQDEDLRYRVAVSDSFAEIKIGREVKDEGRTVGFWQNLGGTGLYKPDSANPLYFTERLARYIKSRPSGVITVIGETWAAILLQMPLSENARSLLAITVPDKKKSPKKRTKKSVTTDKGSK